MAGAKKNDRRVIHLIDGSGYIFRSYYAIKRLTSSKGQATNAVFGFTQMLLRTIREEAPTHLAIAFDLRQKTFRHELYEDYKGNRDAPPEDLPPQIPLIHQVVDAFRIPKLLVPHFEADDALGTVAERAKAAGYDVVIVTGDKDFYQLVDDHVTLLDEGRQQKGTNESTRVGREEVKAHFNVYPEQLVDVMALAGDASDNIKGVRGIGLKTAAELVNTYGDLEKILDVAPSLPQKARREKLMEDAALARLAKTLVTIRRDAPVDVDVDALQYAGPDGPVLRSIFVDLEFTRLLNDPLVRLPDDEQAMTSKKTGGPQGDLFGGAAAEGEEAPKELPLEPVDRANHRTVTDAEGLEAVAKELHKSARIALRTEVDGDPGPAAKLVGIALSWAEGHAAYVAIEPIGEKLVLDTLVPLLRDLGRSVVAHDGKTDVNMLVFHGVPAWPIAGDPMLASYLLDGDTETHSLANLARKHLQRSITTSSDVLGSGKAAVRFSQVPLEKQSTHANDAVDVTLRLANLLEPLVEAERMEPLYKELELPLEAMLGRMERVGILIDADKLAGMSVEFDEELQKLAQRAYASAGREFNLGSPSQIAELLFKELQLPVMKRSKTGPSTDSTVLEQLSDKHELPAIILEHRTIQKLKNTYLDVLPQLRDANGRVHTHFNQAVAATGRLSSSDPNLQNIPIRTELGRRIREAFIAPPGKKLVCLDYSQIELRILAHVTGDKVLVDTFQKNEDVHRRTAAEIFGLKPEEVSKDQRNAAKTINFGLLYGMGVVRLARELGLKRADAKKYLDAYHERYSGVAAWKNEALEKAYAEREVRTLLGRRRKLPEITSKNGSARARAERLANNTPIQGTAADIMKRGMLDTERMLAEHVPSARILLQVHDELVIEVPEADASKALEVGREAMAKAMTLSVPLVVDGGIGSTWNEAK
jgi:DNA polymerase-1